MSNLIDVDGTAALTICEALMLALNDRDILPEKEIVGVLKDAVETHKDAAKEADDPDGDGRKDRHLAVAKVIQRIIDSGNSVRRPKAVSRSPSKDTR